VAEDSSTGSTATEDEIIVLDPTRDTATTPVSARFAPLEPDPPTSALSLTHRPSPLSAGGLIVGVFAVMALFSTVRAIGRLTHELQARSDLFADHPGLAGLVSWFAAAGLWLVLIGAGWHLRRSRLPTPLPAPQPESQDVLGRSVEPRTRAQVWAAHLAEASTYLVASLAMMWPVSWHMSTRLTGQGDAVFFLWQGWRMGELVKRGSLPTHVPDVFWPYGLDQWVSDGFLTAWSTALFASFFAPVLAFNLTILAFTILNMVGGRHLARQFTSARIPIVLTALSFASAPGIYLRIFGHPLFYSSFAAAFLIAEIVPAARGDRPLRPIRLGLLLFLAYITSVYYLLFGALAVTCLLLLSVRSVSDFTNRAKRLVLAVLVCGVLISPFATARLQLDAAETAAGGQPVLTSEAYLYNSDIYSLFSQPKGSSTFDLPWSVGAPPARGLENLTYPGILLLLGIMYLITTRVPLRWPLIATSAILWILSLGPSLVVNGVYQTRLADGSNYGYMPYQLLLSMPGLGSLRAPGRVGFMLIAVLTAGFIAILSPLWAWASRNQRIAISTICLVLIATNLQAPISYASLERTPDEEALFARMAGEAYPGDTVAQFPNDCFIYVADFVYTQVSHELPLVGCQGNTASIPWWSGVEDYTTEAAASLRCQPTVFGRRVGLPYAHDLQITRSHVRELRETFGLRYVLIDKSSLELPACLDGRIAPTAETLQQWHGQLGESERYIVIDLDRQT